MPMSKIADLVKIYVKQRPYLQETLERGVVNYSALAREINKNLKVSPDAIKVALIRISRKLIKEKRATERKVLSILKHSSLEVKSKVAIIIARVELKIPFIAVAKGPSGWTYVVEESALKKLKRKNIIEIEKNLDLIKIVSPREIEKTPGIVAYLLSTLSAENINLVHMISCYKDTLLITQNVDTSKAFKLLSEKLK